jgi:hypothetical protein
MSAQKPYYEIKAFMAGLGGRASWRPGGAGGGGTWELALRGKVGHVHVHDDKANVLDRLYVPGTENPTHSRDFGNDLVGPDEVFWQIVRLVQDGAD